MELLAIMGTLVGILTFVFSCFHYVVLKPLKESIVDLKSLINKVQDNMEEESRVRHKHDITLSVLEQNIRALEDRFAILTKFCMDTHGDHRDLLPLFTSLHGSGVRHNEGS